MGQIWSGLFGGKVQENPTVNVMEDHYARERQREQDQEHAELSKQAQLGASEALKQTQAELQRQLREHDEKMRKQQNWATAALNEAAKMYEDAMKARQEQGDNIQREREIHAAALREAEERAQKAEADLLAGVGPDLLPTRKEFEAMKTAHQYNKHNMHFAVVGSSGTGKSFLVNAIRGLESRDKGAAPTGETETTHTASRYDDARPSSKGRVWWYDIPGGGTLTVPAANYFNNQGLYVFDAILVVFAGRFTELDLAILRHAFKWGIPAYIVRSRADQDVQSRVSRRIGSRAYRSPASRQPALDEERNAYISEVHRNVRENLEKEGLSELAAATDTRCFVVSESAVLRCVEKSDKGGLDGMDRTPIGKSAVVTDPVDLDFEEEKLLRQLVLTTAARRVVDKNAEWLQSIIKDWQHWKVPNSWKSCAPSTLVNLVSTIAKV